MHKSNMGEDGSSSAEMDIMPGYLELATRAYSVMSGVFRDCKDCGLEMSTRTLMDHAYITWKEIFLFILCVVMWTQMRKGLSAFVFQPFGRWCRLHPKDVLKMPESAWKLVFYTMSWSYSTHLLFFTNYSFFQDPPSVFNNWRSGMEVPTDISIAYLIQGSFYGHSIYSTVYMDTWRKDSLVMVGHHFITLALITFSYAFRYHNIGILVLFLHDINDIQLEFTKVNVYFKTRGGKEHFINDVLSNIGVVSFSITWFWFRLYWFPLKVLWASCVTSVQTVPDIPFYFFFNTLLFILLLMNIYWFLFIVLFVVKVLTGQMKSVNDVREYEDGDDADHQTSADGTQVKNGIAKKHQ